MANKQDKQNIPNQREATMLAILVRREEYGREIRNQYEKRTGQVMPLGSLYTTLDRMEEKGFVKSREADASEGRGGNHRRYYKLTGSGLEALNFMQQCVAVPGKGRVANA